MTRRNWKWLVCLSLVVGSGAIGGKPLTPPFPYDGPVAHSLDGIARINAPDVVVASVVSVPDAAGTNGEPPVVKVEIEAVLKGELGTGSRKIIWAPSPFELCEPRYFVAQLLRQSRVHVARPRSSARSHRPRRGPVPLRKRRSFSRSALIRARARASGPDANAI